MAVSIAVVMVVVSVQMDVGTGCVIFRLSYARAGVRMWKHRHLAAKQRENQKYGDCASQHDRVYRPLVFPTLGYFRTIDNLRSLGISRFALRLSLDADRATEMEASIALPFRMVILTSV
ncbi:MAG: hypothetical protein AB7I48_10325 [Planctomycetaceae bacterium]